MLRKLLLGSFLVFVFSQFIFGQRETYSITLAPFSSTKFDEFSPVFYNKGIVFCSNRITSSLVVRSNEKNKGVFTINYIDTTKDMKWSNVTLFSKEIQTSLNDGPVSFSRNSDTIYFSANVASKKSFSDVTSKKLKLGIFYSVFNGVKWTAFRELRINNDSYNVTTPWISSDGRKLYFASDKDGGYGGSDLYCCNRKDDYWDNPVNLGPVINTKGNESFPFVTESGDLYFSSDGHKGAEKKDIYFSKPENGDWLEPVRLDPQINSAGDDFGIVIDSTGSGGYFSSDRAGSIDIYRFKTNFQQIFYSRKQESSLYCFRFSDNEKILLDSTRLMNEWNFGDGKTANGRIAEHCFPGPGKYEVTLSVVEKKTRKHVFLKQQYTLDLRKEEQAFITSPDAALVLTEMQYSGLSSRIPGYTILGYTWNFGDSSRTNDSSGFHIYREPGEYNIQLGVKALKNNTKEILQFGVLKTVMICRDNQELQSVKRKMSEIKPVMVDISSTEKTRIELKYSASADLLKSAVFRVEVLASNEKITTTNETIKRISQKYRVRENLINGAFVYTIGDEMTFLEAYPLFVDVVNMGFTGAVIKTIVLTDPPQIELKTLKTVYGLSSDTFFGKNNFRVSSGGYPMLDQIVSLMKKYPGVKLSVEVYSDDQGTGLFNLELSQKRADAMIQYLTGRGVGINRVSATGYGNSVPLILSNKEENKKLNRRVQFQIMN